MQACDLHGWEVCSVSAEGTCVGNIKCIPVFRVAVSGPAGGSWCLWAAVAVLLLLCAQAMTCSHGAQSTPHNLVIVC